MGEFPSGQRGQTVNLLVIAFDGSNPSSPTEERSLVKRLRSFISSDIENRNIPRLMPEDISIFTLYLFFRRPRSSE